MIGSLTVTYGDSTAANLFAAHGKSIANTHSQLPKAQKAKPQAVEHIGDRVAQARRRLGVTLKRDILPADLARMIDVPASTVSRIEGGDRQPGETLVQKLATALSVSPAWLRYGTVEMSAPVPINEPKSGKGQ